MEILAIATFAVQSTYHRTKDKIIDQLFFGQHMILPIDHVANWRYIRQRKQTQINKNLIREKSTRIDHDYSLGDKSMIKTKSAYE